MRYSRDFRARQPGWRRTLTQQALAILARYGSAANLYLPGVGAINGITAGNWLDSIGMTATAVNNPTGLVVSAGKTVGPERVANGVFDSGITGWTPRRSSIATHSNGCLRCTNGGGLVSGGADTPIACEIGKTYRMSMRVADVSAGMSAFFRVGDKPVDTATSADFRVSVQGVGVGVHSGVFVATQTTHYVFAQANQGTDGSWVEFDDFSVTELPGAHLTQATTANKPILRLSGGVYSWQLNGANNSFSAGAPMFSMSDDHCVIAGSKQLASGNDQQIYSQRGASTTPIVGQLGYNSAGICAATWRSDAGVLVQITGGGVRTGLATVASLRQIDNTRILSVNGATVGTNTLALGGATVTQAAIGVAPVSNQNWFNGSVYPVIAVRGRVSDADKSVLERFIASLSGVAL